MDKNISYPGDFEKLGEYNDQSILHILSLNTTRYSNAICATNPSEQTSHTSLENNEQAPPQPVEPTTNTTPSLILNTDPIEGRRLPSKAVQDAIKDINRTINTIGSRVQQAFLRSFGLQLQSSKASTKNSISSHINDCYTGLGLQLNKDVKCTKHSTKK